jgi:hypothetical protein
MERYRPLIIIGCFLLAIVLVSLLMINLVSVKKGSFETYTTNTDKVLETYSQILEKINDNLTKNSGNITSLHETINGLQSDVNVNNEGYISQLNNINQRLNDIDKTIESNKSYINYLVTTIDTKISKTELDYFNATMENNLIVINNLQNQVKDMQSIITSLTSEIRGYSIQGKVKLIGAEDYNPTVTSGANVFYLARFQCTKSGVLNLIRLRATNYGGIKIAVYSDNGSMPNQLLASNTYDNIVGDGWATISLNDISLEYGKYYWLAYNSATNCVGWTTASTGLIWYKVSSPYSTFTFPDVINSSTGYKSDTRTCLISGWTGF